MLFGQSINDQTTGSCGLVTEAFQQLAFIWVGELLIVYPDIILAGP